MSFTHVRKYMNNAANINELLIEKTVKECSKTNDFIKQPCIFKFKRIIYM